MAKSLVSKRKNTVVMRWFAGLAGTAAMSPRRFRWRLRSRCTQSTAAKPGAAAAMACTPRYEVADREDMLNHDQHTPNGPPFLKNRLFGAMPCADFRPTDRRDPGRHPRCDCCIGRPRSNTQKCARLLLTAEGDGTDASSKRRETPLIEPRELSRDVHTTRVMPHGS